MEPIDEKEIYRRKSAGEPVEIPRPETREVIEKMSEGDRIIREQLEKEVLRMCGRPDLEEEAKGEALKIKELNVEERLRRLLDIAKVKGMVMAVRVCREMNDPYLLDLFHDTLASGGHYKSLSR
ncbi:MAG: hypothetical protein V1905_04130 [bacterium]